MMRTGWEDMSCLPPAPSTEPPLSLGVDPMDDLDTLWRMWSKLSTEIADFREFLERDGQGGSLAMEEIHGMAEAMFRHARAVIRRSARRSQ